MLFKDSRVCCEEDISSLTPGGAGRTDIMCTMHSIDIRLTRSIKALEADLSILHSTCHWPDQATGIPEPRASCDDILVDARWCFLTRGVDVKCGWPDQDNFDPNQIFSHLQMTGNTNYKNS